MRYIESPFTDAYLNMALEEYVFEGLPQSDEYFMLWQNKNAIVVGKYQNTAQEVNADYVRENDIAVVRRLSGGGAMYQDMGNLNFTFVVNQNAARQLDFSLFIQPVIKALAQMGVTATQGSRNDILIDGKKFSGNAQYNRQGRTMHHGTLLFNSHLSVLGSALNPKPDKIESKGIKSVRSRVTNIASYLTAEMTMDDFKRILRQEMFEANALTDYALSGADMAAVRKLAEDKYATWAWNWGHSPASGVQKSRRYPFGGVELAMQVKNGAIADIVFTGDFFGNGDIEDLQSHLKGAALRQDALQQALEGFDVNRIISGMDAAALVELLLY